VSTAGKNELTPGQSDICYLVFSWANAVTNTLEGVDDSDVWAVLQSVMSLFLCILGEGVASFIGLVGLISSQVVGFC
jgi:hypothetical protein